jgi:hypothetical protein
VKAAERIVLQFADRSLTVDGEVVGCFGIHRAYFSVRADEGNYTVTHLFTGYAAGTLRTLKQARAFARDLGKVADWNFTDPGAPKKWPKPVAQMLLDISRKHGASNSLTSNARLP